MAIVTMQLSVGQNLNFALPITLISQMKPVNISLSEFVRMNDEERRNLIAVRKQDSTSRSDRERIKTGSLKVITTPSDAEVFIDGMSVGRNSDTISGVG